MDQTEFKKLFAKNLRRVMVERDKAPADIIAALGVSQPTVSTWMTGKKVPKMETIDDLCAYLHCRRSDLMEERISTLDDERRELVALTMSADIANVRTALLVLKALEENKNTTRQR